MLAIPPSIVVHLSVYRQSGSLPGGNKFGTAITIQFPGGGFCRWRINDEQNRGQVSTEDGTRFTPLHIPPLARSDSIGGRNAAGSADTLCMAYGRPRNRTAAIVLLALSILGTTLYGCTKPQRVVTTAEAATITVYLTRTGQRYHDESCSSLAKSKRAVMLASAARRFQPCANCKPPIVRDK
jgi:hypothetical protein